jgi:hypothetical protein
LFAPDAAAPLWVENIPGADDGYKAALKSLPIAATMNEIAKHGIWDEDEATNQVHDRRRDCRLGGVRLSTGAGGAADRHTIAGL